MEMKTCKKCGENKPLESFSRQARGTQGRQSYCRPCAAEYARMWAAKPGSKTTRERDPERARATARRRYEAKRDSLRQEANRRYYADREASIARARAWQRANPEKMAAYKARRRALKSGSAAAVLDLDWRAVADRDGMNCAYCQRVTAELHSDHGMRPTLDHVVPITHGGAHSLSNAVLACRSCNSSKGNRPLSEWKGRPTLTVPASCA